MKTTEKISFVLTPQIKWSNNPVKAGTEVVFASDLLGLRNHYQVAAFARCNQEINLITRLYYPIWMIRLAEFVERHQTWRYGFCSRVLRDLADLLFSISAAIKALGSRCVISYSFPLQAVFFPRKTIVIIGADQYFPFHQFLSHRYQKAKYLYCSEFLRKQALLKYSFLDNQNTAVLYNSVSSSFFKKKKKLVKKTVKFLFSSAWVPEKGLDVLLEAIQQLPPEDKKCCSLTIASNASLWFEDFPEKGQQYIDGIRQRLDALSYVRLLDGVAHSQMPEVYQRHDWLVVPSMWEEPFGLVVAESIASGTPVVAFYSGGIPEIITHLENGVLIREKTSKALSGVLRQIIHKQIDITKPAWSKKNTPMRELYRSDQLKRVVDEVVFPLT